METICRDPDLWLKTMLQGEHGVAVEQVSPEHSALATFVAFLVVGAIPLVPYALPGLEVVEQFLLSLGLAGGIFVGIGMRKSVVYGLSPWRSGLRTLVMGGTAAGLALATGFLAEFCSWAAKAGLHAVRRRPGMRQPRVV